MRIMISLIVVATLVLATALYSSGTTRAQVAGGNGPAANGGGPGGRGRFPGNPQQFFKRMQQRMLDRIKKQLKVNDQVWSVLKPRVQKVQQLVFQNRMMHFMGGPGGPRGRFRGRRGRGPGMFNQSANPVIKAEMKLRKVLQNSNASASEIKSALAGLRQAKADAKAKLNAARQNLRQLLTVRQEAVLVLDGLLNY